MRRSSVWLLVAVLGLAGGCTMAANAPTESTAAKPPDVPAGGARAEMVLEVETFELDDAQVKDLPGASGGKAVFFGSDAGTAVTTVALKKGAYAVTCFAQGADDEHDAFFVSFAGAYERLFPSGDYGQVGPTATFSVTIAQDGPVKISVMAAEPGVYVDRLVLKSVP